jgi:hypothetical protein
MEVPPLREGAANDVPLLGVFKDTPPAVIAVDDDFLDGFLVKGAFFVDAFFEEDSFFDAVSFFDTVSFLLDEKEGTLWVIGVGMGESGVRVDGDPGSARTTGVLLTLLVSICVFCVIGGGGGGLNSRGLMVVSCLFSIVEISLCLEEDSSLVAAVVASACGLFRTLLRFAFGANFALFLSIFFQKKNQ